MRDYYVVPNSAYVCKARVQYVRNVRPQAPDYLHGANYQVLSAGCRPKRSSAPHRDLVFPQEKAVNFNLLIFCKIVGIG